MALALAGCGTPSPDLFEVKRSGEDRNANVDVVVNDGGQRDLQRQAATRSTPTCLLRARQLLRDLEPQAELHLELPPGPRSQLRYRARMEAGHGLVRGHLARQPALVPRARRVHQGRHRGRLRAGPLSVGPVASAVWRSCSPRSRRATPSACARSWRPTPRSPPRATRPGSPAVLTALYHRQAEALDVLLAAGPELDVLDAAATGRLDVLRAHLESDQDALAARSPEGFTPLHLAAFFGGAAAVRHAARRRRARRRRPGEPGARAAAALRRRRRATTRPPRRCWTRAPTPTPSSRAATRRCSPPRTATTRDGRAAARATAPTARSRPTTAATPPRWPGSACAPLLA